MRRLLSGLLIGVFVGLLGVTVGEAASACGPDAVQVGPVCVDKYEASVWSIPPDEKGLIKKVKQGKATLEKLIDGGATQVSPSASCSPAFPESFPSTGNWSAPLYAVSIAGVPPTACVSWFQAEQACALSGKRLLTNQEWQRAAAGTPDPGAADDGSTTCVTNSAGPANSGSRSACVSSWGAFDMVGNAWEWVGDWGTKTTFCTHWSAEFGSDWSCSGGDAPGAAAATLPSAPLRSGSWIDGSGAGVFAFNSLNSPAAQLDLLGFRCAR